MKDSIIAFLKVIWRKFGVRQFYLSIKSIWLLLNWYFFRNAIDKNSDESKNRVLIIPSDPELLISSLGDQAMIGSIMDYWGDKLPGAEFYFIVDNDVAFKRAEGLGANAIVVDRRRLISELEKKVIKIGFSHAILMGADGLDGSYNPLFSVQQLLLADINCRAGSEVFITGFSVSKYFNFLAVFAFKMLSDQVRVCLRDPASLARFREKISDKGELVADVAFMLKPEVVDNSDSMLAWIDGRKADGLTVIGYNAHPLLLELEDRDRIGDLIKAMSSMLDELMHDSDVGVVLLSHDTRGESSDSHVIDRIYSDLMGKYSDRIYLQKKEYSARQIKYVVSCLDAVVTGRMHLMIACIGVNTPVLGINYKDKMEGLLRHLGMNTNNLLDANFIMTDSKEACQFILRFIDECDSIKDCLVSTHDSILEMSKNNFDII